MQRLYGNISGYIGFFLGYSLFQIPSFFRSLIRFVKRAFNRITNKLANKGDNERISTSRTTIENKKERNIEEELKHFNMELYEMSRKFQELHDFMRR